MPYYLNADLKSKLHIAATFVIDDLRKFSLHNTQFFGIFF
jgi:hypothetical protein